MPTKISEATVAKSLDLPLGGLPQGRGKCYLVKIYPVGGPGGLVALSQSRLTLGRDAACSLEVSDDSVSRRHAMIETVSGGHVVTDLNSTNGTYVNDERIVSRVLRAGDRIRLGNQIFKFLADGDVEAQYHETVFQMITTDGLTSVYNKRYLLDLLEREIARSRRYQRPLSLLMLDIDHFKIVNDTYGHLAGDEVLQELCRRTRGLLRKDEVLARYGGEEFAVVLPETCLADALVVAQRVRQAISAEPISTEVASIPITISGGLVEYTGEKEALPADLLRAADELLYVAKWGGRNQICS